MDVIIHGHECRDTKAVLPLGLGTTLLVELTYSKGMYIFLIFLNELNNVVSNGKTIPLANYYILHFISVYFRIPLKGSPTNAK